MNETVHFIITGGTIDSYYEGKKDTVVPLKESAIPDYINSLKLFIDVKFDTVCMKDSRDITDSDRAEIINIIRKSPYKKIIITHGTYTMPETARYLESNLEDTDKTIILTGSMIPLIGFAPTDAPFNLGFSLSEIFKLRPGIKVCMNGRVFSSGEATKVIEEGRFDSIYNR